MQSTSNISNLLILSYGYFVCLAPEPPMVLTCPVDSCNVSVKQSATFAVTATGSKPLKYQWQRNTLTETAENWKPLAPDGNSYQGADTANLTFPSVGKDDVGRYRCRISNEVGIIVSNSAVLTVGKILIWGFVCHDIYSFFFVTCKTYPQLNLQKSF